MKKGLIALLFLAGCDANQQEPERLSSSSGIEDGYKAAIIKGSAADIHRGNIPEEEPQIVEKPLVLENVRAALLSSYPADDFNRIKLATLAVFDGFSLRQPWLTADSMEKPEGVVVCVDDITDPHFFSSAEADMVYVKSHNGIYDFRLTPVGSDPRTLTVDLDEQGEHEVAYRLKKHNRVYSLFLPASESHLASFPDKLIVEISTPHCKRVVSENPSSIDKTWEEFWQSLGEDVVY